VSFVGVATSDSRQDILESNKLEKKQFLNLIDSDGIVSTALGVDSLPATLLVDASGHVRYRVKGRLIGPSLMMLARELENISKETPND